MKIIKASKRSELPENFTGIVEVSGSKIYPEGTIIYFSNGKFHKEDGPAVERANGNKEYWVNDYLHRIDGPAVEYQDGRKEYWVNGKRHRIDGPAIEWADGSKEHEGYYIDDKEITKEAQELLYFFMKLKGLL